MGFQFSGISVKLFKYKLPPTTGLNHLGISVKLAKSKSPPTTGLFHFVLAKNTLTKEHEDYESCAKMLSELEALGYTFDYYLDAVPFNLRLKN